MSYTICRVAPDYPSGSPSYGLQPVFFYLSKEQALLGHQVHVFAAEMPGESKIQEEDGVVVHRLAKPFSVNVVRQVHAFLKSNSNVVVHTHATGGLLIAATKRSLPSPIVAHVHGTTRYSHIRAEFGVAQRKVEFSVLNTTYYYAREKLCWVRADSIVAVSNEVRRNLIRFYGISDSRIDVVYNGVDTRLFRPGVSGRLPDVLGRLKEAKVIGYVGHFGARKGLGILLLAMREVIKEVSDAFLICIGGFPTWQIDKDYESYLIRLVQTLGLTDRVFFLERIPNEDLPQFYSACRAIALPSFYESLGKVLIEAMACGRPVIATRGGGTGEVVTDRKTGLLVDYGSVSQLAVALIQVLQDEKLGERMGIEGRRVVEERFTWHEAAKSIDKIYDRVLREKMTSHQILNSPLTPRLSQAK